MDGDEMINKLDDHIQEVTTFLQGLLEHRRKMVSTMRVLAERRAAMHRELSERMASMDREGLS